MRRLDGKPKAVYAWVVVTAGGVRREAYVTPKIAASRAKALTEKTGTPHHVVLASNGITKRVRGIEAAAKKLLRQINAAYPDAPKAKP